MIAHANPLQELENYFLFARNLMLRDGPNFTTTVDRPGGIYLVVPIPSFFVTECLGNMISRNVFVVFPNKYEGVLKYSQEGDVERKFLGPRLTDVGPYYKEFDVLEPRVRFTFTFLDHGSEPKVVIGKE